MQKFVLKLAGMGLILSTLFFNSCGEDPIIENPLGPEIQFVSDPATLSGDADVIINQGFAVKIRLIKGDAALKSVEVQAGGIKVASSRLTINSGSVTSNNPFLITGADQDGATYTIDIASAGTEAVNDITTYTFTVTDQDNRTDVVDLVITTIDEPGTPIAETLTGVLLNQAGPAGTGGLNLDNGDGTGSADGAAEIRDLGIDCTINPDNAENWRAQFGTVNGANMVKVDLTQVENFTFDGVSKIEEIEGAYTSGITLADGVSQNPSCVETVVTDVTGTVAVGDLFVVFANSKYYLIRVDEINAVSGSNGDNFKISIKY
ncbi:MAG: hypothetical protein R2795_14285 [Saprospiraceae bacterium]